MPLSDRLGAFPVLLVQDHALLVDCLALVGFTVGVEIGQLGIVLAEVAPLALHPCLFLPGADGRVMWYNQNWKDRAIMLPVH